MIPTPTTRAVIDPLRKCPLRCRACYYLHGDMQSIKSWPQVRDEINAAKARGNNCCDVTGGEPLVYPPLTELVRYCNKVGLPARVITSLIGTKDHVAKLLDAGIPGWLISIHGLEPTHDAYVNMRGARKRQEAELALIAGRATVDVNCVMTSMNQGELADIARYLIDQAWRPRIVNFIQFNPHHQWKQHPDTQALVADLDVVEPQLNEAIGILETADTAVNVRYYPMCRIAERYRRCVCNDLHVVFDAGEWDYDIQPKTVDAFHRYAEQLSARTEEKGEPCRSCDLQNICGGANKWWHLANTAARGEQLRPQRIDGVADYDDVYHYRYANERGMAVTRVQSKSRPSAPRRTTTCLAKPD